MTVYKIPAHRRSLMIASAMAEGIQRAGDRVTVEASTDFVAPSADVAVFYGFDPDMRSIFAAYRAAGLPVVYVDLGYFGRHHGGRWSGYHKVSVNGRHPTAYFQARRHDAARARMFGLSIEPWRRGRAIMLAGMSDKAAAAENLAPEEWERSAARALRKITDRPILYRPKPNWSGATPIAGTEWRKDSPDDVAAIFGECHAIVTHHSNVAVDGLIAGVPAFTVDGVASPLAHDDLALIESPRTEGDRRQWVNDLCYCQWSVAEMSDGLPWRHLKNEGLVP